MAKSKIIKDLVDGDISVNKVLSRIVVLANDIEDYALKEWAENELNGYKDSDIIPEYRKLKSLNFTYSGIDGNLSVSNKPLDVRFFNKKSFNEIIILDVREPISCLEKYAESLDSKYIIDRTYLANEVYKNSRDGLLSIQCTSISQEFQPSQFEGIIRNVKTKILDILLKLDKEFGNLDNLDIGYEKISKKKIKKVKQDINVNIFKGNVKIKGSNINSENGKVNGRKKVNNKNSNIGEGSNNVKKETEFKTNVDINKTQKNEKDCWLKRLFGRRKNDR